MKDTVQITVLNKQIMDNNQVEELNYKGEGNLYFKNNKIYLNYNDQSLGLDGVSTTLKINKEDQRVLLLREKPFYLKHVFRSGESSEGYYRTSEGSLKLKIHTSSVSISIDNNEGKLSIQYRTYLGNSFLADNHLEINWKIK